MIDTQTLMILAIIFLGGFVSSTLGFGLGLIAMPLLAFIVDLKTATPLIVVVGTTSSFFIFVKNWRKVNFRSIWRLVLASIVGIPIGLYALKGAGDAVMKVILALMIISFALYSLLGRFNLTLKTEKTSYLAGFLSGVIGSAYNMGGPPVIIYGALRKWSPVTFRATLQSFFLLTNFFLVIGHYFGGLITPPVVKLYLYSLPIIIFTTGVGGILNRSIPTERFNRVVYVFLILIGSFLLIKSIQ